MPPKRKESPCLDDEGEGASKAGGHRPSPSKKQKVDDEEKRVVRPFSREEDLLIIDYFESLKSHPAILARLSSAGLARDRRVVHKRVQWILGKMRAYAGRWP